MTVDFHTHIFPDAIASRTVSALASSAAISPHADGTACGLRTAMEHAGVTLAVNLPVLTRPKQFESVTAFARELNATEQGSERILSFAGIHPAMEDAIERLHELKAMGFLGIKIHPDYQNTFIDDELYVRILSCAKKLDLITVTHAGLDGAYIGQPIRCTPRRVLTLLDKIGGYDKLVLAHLGGNALYDEVYREIAGKDVYIDTAYTLHDTDTDAFLRLLERHGDHRVLFATDSPWRDIAEERSRLLSMGLGQACEERILSGNAIRLLGWEGRRIV